MIHIYCMYMIYTYVLPPTYSSSMQKLLENFEGQASQKNASGMKNTQWKIIKRECKSNHKQTVKAKRQSLPILKHVMSCWLPDQIMSFSWNHYTSVIKFLWDVRPKLLQFIRSTSARPALHRRALEVPNAFRCCHLFLVPICPVGGTQSAGKSFQKYQHQS